MTFDDIVDIAEKAGCDVSAIDGREYQAMWCDYYQLERFAAALIQAGAASRDAEVYTKQGAIEMLNHWNDELLAQIKQKDAEIAELVCNDYSRKEYEMNTEQQRKMLECAAKACGLRHVDYTGIDYDGSDGLVLVNENGCHTRAWNPRAIALDTAEMCAKLGIGTRWYLLNDCVVCGPSYSNVTAYFKDHDNSRLKAWMFAATMVAAKIGGYENDV